jgi:ribokinase
MFDTISVGSATLDIFLRSAQFAMVENFQDEISGLCLPYGSKLDVEDFALQSGGGATNTAVAFARLGLKAAVIAEVGKDLPAQVIKQELALENVDTSLLIEEPDERTAISALLIGKDGDRSALTARGASKMLTVEDMQFNKMLCHWMHLSSIGNIELIVALAQHCKKERIRFSWNPGGAELAAMEQGKLHPTEIYPTIFFANEEEADRLQKAGYELETLASMVVVTAADEGGRYYEHGAWHDFTAAPVKMLQATGAGDAFASGVISGFLHDRRTREAIEWGKANAGSVIQNMGAKTGLRRDLATLRLQDSRETAQEGT